jgi:UDP-N-acetylmuramyl pentapeptide phosphotransferase/UDP-N-acetylglucosamine-1-phosphate transferase
MILALITPLLSLLLIAYFRIADRFNIIDKPNSRSSHTIVTIRGGGVVFPFAMLLYAAFYSGVSLTLLTGILMISIVSFWDDVKNLPNKVRLLVHLLSVTALLLSVHALQSWPLWLLPIAFILIIGTLNAYNFMDGINGMTGLYSIVCLSSLLYVNTYVTNFTDSAFIIFPIIACFVFLFFNFRTKAKCFAGDVGSVSIGFWIIALLVMAVLKTGAVEYILFLAVYGVDTVLTIVHRLLLKQNIFEAHRLHFYQILSNDQKVSHLVVSSVYGVIQVMASIVILTTEYNFIITSLVVLPPLVLLYVVLKPKLMVESGSNVRKVSLSARV